MEIKSHTDIPQSKTLSKILPLESADHCFLNDGTAAKAEINSYDVAIQLWKDNYVNIIPCWSLVALLNVLHKPSLYHTLNNGWRCDSFNKKGRYELGPYTDNPIDACYEMILKLHKQNLL